MKTQIKWSVLLAAVVALGACSGQPTPPCAVGHGGYAAKYTQVAGGCTGFGCEAAPSATSGACVRAGDLIGVDKYRPTVTGGKQTVYLKTEPLAEATYGVAFGNLAPGTGHGELPQDARDANNFCTVPSITDITGTTLAGATLTYKFSNVKFYMTGAVPGTQFKADLELTGTDARGSCTATYTVDALYPAVFCFAAADDGTPTTALDQAACAAPDAWWSYVQANPEFDMTCQNVGNAAQGDEIGDVVGYGFPLPKVLCVPTKAIPSLK